LQAAQICWRAEPNALSTSKISKYRLLQRSDIYGHHTIISSNFSPESIALVLAAAAACSIRSFGIMPLFNRFDHPAQVPPTPPELRPQAFFCPQRPRQVLKKITETGHYGINNLRDTRHFLLPNTELCVSRNALD
jgi:hypothetical protein